MRACSNLPAARQDGSPNRDKQEAPSVGGLIPLSPAARFNLEGPYRNREAVPSSKESVGVLRKQAVPIDLEAEIRNQEVHCEPTVPVGKPAVGRDIETPDRNREVSSDVLPAREFVIENQMDLAETVIEDQGIIRPLKQTESMQKPETLPLKL